MLGFSIIVLDDMLIKHFGSHLEDGVISRLQYARTLMKVPMGVFGLAAGMAAYPTVARLIAQDRSTDAFKLMTDAVGLIIVLALIAQSALPVSGDDMAEVIWGRTRFTMDGRKYWCAHRHHVHRSMGLVSPNARRPRFLCSGQYLV